MPKGSVPRTVAIVALLASAAFACLWDTDTLQDELQTSASDFDLITGQFPHHGKAYYEARVKRLQPRVERDSKDLTLRNDLAVAYLRLERFEDARHHFEVLLAQDPNRYETLSNLGVFHKKTGDLEKAIDYTAQALALKPEGHLGLGDDYLKMLRWRAAMKANSSPATWICYLGHEVPRGFEADPYIDGDLGDRIRAMIRADRTFPDAMLVFGDELRTNWSLHLALWAYVRALDLGHPDTEGLEIRIGLVFRHWNDAVKHDGAEVQEAEPVLAKIRTGLQKAGDWIRKFESVEAELVAGGDHVDFKAVEAEMNRRGIERYRPREYIGVEPGGLHTSVLLLAGAGLAALLALILGLRRARLRRPERVF